MRNILALLFLFFYNGVGAALINSRCLSGQLNLDDDNTVDCEKCKDADAEEFCFDLDVLTDFCGDVPQRPCPAMMVQDDLALAEEYCGKCYKRVLKYDCEEVGCTEAYVKVVRAQESTGGLQPKPAGMYVTGNVFAETCTVCLDRSGIPQFECRDPQEGGPLTSCISRSTDSPVNSLRLLQGIPDFIPDVIPVLKPCDGPLSLAMDFRNVEFEYEEVDCDSGPEPTEPTDLPTPPTTTTPAPPAGSFYGEAACGSFEELDGNCGDDLTIEEWEKPCGDYPINSCPMLISSSATEYDEIECGKCYKMSVEFDCTDKPALPICSDSYSIFVTRRGEFNSSLTDSSNIHLPSHSFLEVCPAGCFKFTTSEDNILPRTEFSCMFSLLDTCMDISGSPEDLIPIKGLPINNVCETGLYKKIIEEIIGASDIDVDLPDLVDPKWSSRVILTEVDCSEGPTTEDVSTETTEETTVPENTTAPKEESTVDESDNSATVIALLAFGICQISI